MNIVVCVFYNVSKVLPLIILFNLFFSPVDSIAQNLDMENKLTRFEKNDGYATPFQKIVLLDIDKELLAKNNVGSEAVEFDVGPVGGVVLETQKKGWFLTKELQAGEKLFEVSVPSGKKLYCNTQAYMDFRYCMFDADDDGLFDFQCNALTEVRAAQATFFPEQMKYAILRISTPCFTLDDKDKPKYSKIASDKFERVRLRIIAEKLPFNQIRVSWGVPYNKNNFQWGGLIQEVIPSDKSEYIFSIGGVVVNINLKKLVAKDRKFEVKMIEYDTSVPFINIDKLVIYSPFMRKTVLQ